MKILILGAIFCSISYIGFQFGNGYKEKVDFYNEFNNFILFLKSRIGFLKQDLISVCNEYKTDNKNFNKLIKLSMSKMTTGESFNLSFLTEDENLQINNFFSVLGTSDCFTQNEFLDHQIEIFKRKLQESENNNFKYANLYKKLGVLLGFLVIIVFA